jgi:hypothetical protein
LTPHKRDVFDEVMHDLTAFQSRQGLILAKRRTADLLDVVGTAVTGDLLGDDV